MCSLSCDVPTRIRHCLFDCSISKQIWQLATKMSPTKLTKEYLLCNINLNIQQISKINSYLGCIIRINAKKFGLVELNTDPTIAMESMRINTIHTHLRLYKIYYKTWVDLLT